MEVPVADKSGKYPCHGYHRAGRIIAVRPIPEIIRYLIRSIKEVNKLTK